MLLNNNIKNRVNLVLNEGYTNKKILFEKGLGSKIFFGRKKFTDLSFGAGSLLLGHNSYIYKYAIKSLLKKNISMLASPNIQADNFSKLLKKIFPRYSKFIYCNSGTEAIIKSLRICKAITKKDLIIAVTGSWHGFSTGELGWCRRTGIHDHDGCRWFPDRRQRCQVRYRS